MQFGTDIYGPWMTKLTDFGGIVSCFHKQIDIFGFSKMSQRVLELLPWNLCANIQMTNLVSAVIPWLFIHSHQQVDICEI